MATIKDISSMVNVSTASVSKVLNGNYANVSETTKDRILAAAKELKYYPNRIARGLVKSRTSIIGLVVPDISNPYYAELAKGVEEYAENNGYNVILCNTYDDPKKERRYVNMLIEYNAGGVILTGMVSYDEKSVLALSDLGIPFVTIDRFAAEACASFSSNGQRGSFISTEYLIRLGHKAIAFIGGEDEAVTGRANERFLGYRAAMKLNGLETPPELVRLGSYHMETGYQCTNELLDGGRPFTAIVCANDLIAFGAIKAIREHGLDVPKDISLTGYDDIILASFFAPKLTTIRQDACQMGKDALGELLRFITGARKEKIMRSVEPELIIRETACKLQEVGLS